MDADNTGNVVNQIEQDIITARKQYGQDNLKLSDDFENPFFNAKLDKNQSGLYVDKIRSSLICQTKDIKKSYPVEEIKDIKFFQKNRAKEIEKIESECDLVVVINNKHEADSRTHVENWYFCHSFLICSGSVVFQKWFDDENNKREKRNENKEVRDEYVIMNPPVSYKCWTIFMAYIYTGVMSYDCVGFQELVEFANSLRADHFKTALMESLKESNNFS